MNLIIVLLTAALIVNCLILMLLVLMQLPKKEAGSGLAFGAGASDALFGSGSGNVLTKATKYIDQQSIFADTVGGNECPSSKEHHQQIISPHAARDQPPWKFSEVAVFIGACFSHRLLASE